MNCHTISNILLGMFLISVILLVDALATKIGISHTQVSMFLNYYNVEILCMALAVLTGVSIYTMRGVK